MIWKNPVFASRVNSAPSKPCLHLPHVGQFAAADVGVAGVQFGDHLADDVGQVGPVRDVLDQRLVLLPHRRPNRRRAGPGRRRSRASAASTRGTSASTRPGGRASLPGRTRLSGSPMAIGPFGQVDDAVLAVLRRRSSSCRRRRSRSRRRCRAPVSFFVPRSKAKSCDGRAGRGAEVVERAAGRREAAVVRRRTGQRDDAPGEAVEIDLHVDAFGLVLLVVSFSSSVSAFVVEFRPRTGSACPSPA